jgi:hypothetical protein
MPFLVAADVDPFSIGRFDVFIQGVAAFAVTLFFTKLISYTFLDWLPYYVKNTRTLLS